MTSLLKHIFLLVGLAALVYFLVSDLESKQPSIVDLVVFAIGFVSMFIYVIQSILRVRARTRNLQAKRDIGGQ